MAKQNFDIQSAHREDYVGDFQNILLSMRTLKVELSNTIRQIDNSATQVSSASGQVSTGAQTLSQGSIEQASSIQELAATINDISESAKKTSAAAGEAGHFVSQAGAQLGHKQGLAAKCRYAGFFCLLLNIRPVVCRKYNYRHLFANLFTDSLCDLNAV